MQINLDMKDLKTIRDNNIRKRTLIIILFRTTKIFTDPTLLEPIIQSVLSNCTKDSKIILLTQSDDNLPTYYSTLVCTLYHKLNMFKDYDKIIIHNEDSVGISITNSLYSMESSKGSISLFTDIVGEISYRDNTLAYKSVVILERDMIQKVYDSQSITLGTSGYLNDLLEDATKRGINVIQYSIPSSYKDAYSNQYPYKYSNGDIHNDKYINTDNISYEEYIQACSLSYTNEYINLCIAIVKLPILTLTSM